MSDPNAGWADFLLCLYEQGRRVWTDSELFPWGFTPTRIRYRWTGLLGPQVSELTFEEWVSLKDIKGAVPR
jgi:hypothetical protein